MKNQNVSQATPKKTKKTTHVQEYSLFSYSHVWWKLKKVDPHVKIHLFVIVDVQFFVGIHRHQQCANVGLIELKFAL